MPPAYINQLNRLLDEAACVPAPQRPNLHERFQFWYDALPEISRHRPFAMVEIEQALGTQGKYLSPVLLSLGWQRHRKWSSRGQYYRYWVPPLLIVASANPIKD